MLKKFFKTGIVDDSEYKYEPMNFKVGLSFQSIMKLSLAAIAFVFVLITFIIWFIIRRKKRKKIQNV